MGQTIKPVETTYTPNPNTREYVLFPEQYFAGANVSIYFGPKRVLDVSGFQFMLQEQQKPIFSYASRTFDEVAIGNRIVTGYFKVAFQDSGKLNAILNEIENYNVDAESATQLFTKGEDIPAWVGEAGYTAEDLLGMALAYNPNIKDDSVTVSQIYFLGNRIFFPPDHPPRVITENNGNSSVWIAIAFMLESLGYKKSVDALNGTVSFSNRDNSSIVTLKKNYTELYLDGKKIEIILQSIEDRTYVPVGTLFSAMGYKVEKNDKGILITRQR